MEKKKKIVGSCINNGSLFIIYHVRIVVKNYGIIYGSRITHLLRIG